MLDVILRTCDRQNVHGGERYVKAPKAEIVLRCLNSLVRSLNEVPHGIKLTVIDDRSTVETRNAILSIVSLLKHPHELVALNEGNGGFNNAIRLAFERARDAQDLVYLIEDDYLHYSNAVKEMLASYDFFVRNLGPQVPVALFPEDDPHNYRRMESCRIVQGSDRPWRTTTHTTCSMFIHNSSVKMFWGLFDQMAHYTQDPKVNEETTLNRMWWTGGGVSLFSPLTSLAYHLQDLPPKFEDWRPLWEQNKRS